MNWNVKKVVKCPWNHQPKVFFCVFFFTGIPYSEHSSYSELKRFVQFVHSNGPNVKILPTVNVGNPQQRAFMETHFEKWLSESTSKMTAMVKSPQPRKQTPTKRSSQSAQGTSLMQFLKKKWKIVVMALYI